MKKLFSMLTAVAMVATIVPVSTLAASYSDELQGAYDYAYGIGITTQSSIDSANMYGDLTRAAMAKMMANYAKEVLSKKADTTKSCSFADVDSSLGDLEASITEACQMGIMGVNMTSFNPQGKVTRAEFGTALSRVLFGDKYNGGNPYYANHLSALKEAGVMTNISTPNAKEVRGYVMLMMKRADDSNVANAAKPAVCSTAENTLACSLGLDSCPAECKDVPTDTTETEVKAGSISISLNSDSAVNGTQVPSTGTVRFAVVDFKASSSDVSLKTVELSKIGLASIPSSTRVWFEKDGIRISGKAAFSSEGKAVISFAPQYVVKAGSTSSLDLYVELATDAGQDFQFASSDIGSTAENVNGSFTTPVLRTANYTVAPVEVKVASTTGSYSASANGLELGAFSLENKDMSSETRDLKFKSITLRLGGTADISNLSDIVLERNGEVVAKNPTINSKDLTFSVGNTIKDGTTATYYIKAVVSDVENEAGDTYQFSIRNASDVNVSEMTTAFRSTITLTDSYLRTYTVNGGDMAFARDTSTELAANYAAGTEDVVLMKGTITSKSAVTLEDPTISFTTDNLQVTGTSTIATGASRLDELFTTIYLKIGSSTFSYSPVAGDTGAKFLGTVSITSSASVKMYGKLKDNTPAKYVKFGDMKLDSFNRAEYVANGNKVASSIGSIAGIQVTAQTATLNITKSDALGNTTVAPGTKGLLVYGITLTSDQGNGALVSNIVLNVSGDNLTGGLYNNGFLNLYANGKLVDSQTIKAATVAFSNFSSIKVTKTSPLVLEVKADFTDTYTTGAVQFSLASMNAVDALTSKTVTFVKPNGAIFTMGGAQATLALSDNNPLAQLFLSPSTSQKIAAFKLTAKNDGVKLYDVVLTGTNLDKLSNFRIANNSGEVFATATTTTSTGVTFVQIANAPMLAADKTESYYVLADVNTNSTGSFTLSVAKAGTDVKSSNGSVVAVVGSSVVANAHALAQNTMVVAKAANPSKGLTTSALRFTVTANGKDTVMLTGINFNNLIAGYTTTTSKVTVYKNSIDAGNIAGSSATGTVTGLVPLTANNTVDAGNTVTYIVVVTNAIIDSTANSVDWSVSASNIFAEGIQAANYNNVGSFPMTETK